VTSGVIFASRNPLLRHKLWIACTSRVSMDWLKLPQSSKPRRLKFHSLPDLFSAEVMIAINCQLAKLVPLAPHNRVNHLPAIAARLLALPVGNPYIKVTLALEIVAYIAGAFVQQ